MAGEFLELLNKLWQMEHNRVKETYLLITAARRFSSHQLGPDELSPTVCTDDPGQVVDLEKAQNKLDDTGRLDPGLFEAYEYNRREERWLASLRPEMTERLQLFATANQVIRPIVLEQSEQTWPSSFFQTLYG